MIKTILKIEGMMCSMCEGHVADSIRSAIPLAKKVKASRRKGLCSFVTEDQPDDELIKKTIADTGYELLSISHE